MINLACWNIRGLNATPKQLEVRKMILDHKLSLVCLIETRVSMIHKPLVVNSVFTDWEMLDNYNSHDLGRIWIGWDPRILKITKLFETDQIIHCQAHILDGNDRFHISFVYGSNVDSSRRALWHSICSDQQDTPWMVLGDFNVSRRVNESVGGSTRISSAMEEFNDCLYVSELDDLRFSGFLHTWCNKRSIGCISKKLDRVLVNKEWMAKFEHSEAIFLPPSISDHSPSLVKLGLQGNKKNCPFKFFNFLTEREDFLPLVESCWQENFHGNMQFQLCSKLRNLKKVLKSLNKNTVGDLTVKSFEAKAALVDCQSLLDLQPLDEGLRMQEKELMSSYTLALQTEEDFLRQKSRVQWLKAGDRNTSYFSKVISGRRNRSKILSITREDGSLIEGDTQIKSEAVHHFQNILGCSLPSRHGSRPLRNVIDKHISTDQADFMSREVTNDEIREVCFSLHPNKAPGPDGFNAHFFKKTWHIVGDDVITAVQEFFRTGLLLKELNATILTLVPKVPNPSKMTDFRPISCCNTLYKIIAKIIANRIKPCLPGIISPSQSAFVAGRRIGDNILLVQELMRNYHKDDGTPKLALKVDLMKAFDMVDWGFLLDTLAAFQFPLKVINWIRACLTTPKFSISINGELAGFFSGKRGLRQGDPMSPYLFVMAMEVLSKLLANHIADSPNFKYHWKCDKIQLSHLCFADDLIMLCHGSYHSALVLKSALDEFSLLSGLGANHAKSNTFISGVPNAISQQLINLFGYTVGSLPIRYLGIPIISSKLNLRDCSPLVDKVSSRLSSWLNRCLSYAGRLQLIISVLTSSQVFWASHLCLPKRILKVIEQKFRSFLWNGVEGSSKGSKIAWSDICIPKKEGGLGIKDLSLWNKALMIRHIWNLVYGTNNLWTSWINAYHLKGSSLWEVKAPHTCSWNWRKLLHLRPLVRPLFQHIIGSGLKTSLWFDNWHPDGPIRSKWSSRVIYDSGLPINAKVNAIVRGDNWRWPVAMSIDLAEIKSRMPSYNPNSLLDDIIRWLPSPNGIYSAASAMESLRTHHSLVPWFNIVWFPQNIPRMGFILWLAIKGRLSTLDRVQRYDPQVIATCVLCNSQTETHAHLFFECLYSKAIWTQLLNMCGCTWIGLSWNDFIDWISIHWKGNSPSTVTKKLCLAVAVYFIWRERNCRIFKSTRRLNAEVARTIIDIIRSRLCSINLKHGPLIAMNWNVTSR